ncbi:MAG: hypothetical protein AB7K36_21490 [Chloroflexota bacterium]
MEKDKSIDPRRLTPAASLNRVRFVEVPGLPLPAEMLGRTAYHLLAARSVAELAQQEMGVAGVNPPPDILLQLHRALADSSMPLATVAQRVAERVGMRLGWLVVTLRRGDPASRDARPDWDDSYWRHWAGISTIYLGGGIASGRLGPHIARQANAVLEAAGMEACAVQISHWPQQLSLVGGARLIPALPEVSAAAVLDFGQSIVKRGCARYEDRTLASLQLLPPVSARWTVFPPGVEQTAEDVARLGEFMATTLAETWQAVHSADGGTVPGIVASFASYLRDGQPLARQGGPYASLLRLSDNLEDWLSRRVSEITRRALTVSLLHDGTAAATTYAGEQSAAVIMLGTALGYGFPPDSRATTPLAPHFTVASAEGA